MNDANKISKSLEEKGSSKTSNNSWLISSGDIRALKNDLRRKKKHVLANSCVTAYISDDNKKVIVSNVDEIL